MNRSELWTPQEAAAWIAKAQATVRQLRDAGGITPCAYCVANQKGGVGKTTFTINFGAMLATLGFRVWIWDLDPQANASIGLGVKPNKRGTYYAIEDEDAAIHDFVHPTAIDNLFVLPGHQKLKELEPGLAMKWTNYKDMIADRTSEAGEQADIHIFDTPGSLSPLTFLGLYAASRVVVPFAPGYFELLGVKNLTDEIKNIAEDREDYPAANGGKAFGIDHVILTNYAGQERVSIHSEASVYNAFKGAYVPVAVPRRTGVPSAQSEAQPITLWEPTNAAALAFAQITKYITERDKVLA